VRLQLARLLIEHDQRPAQALKVMERIRDSELDDRMRQVHKQLVAKARHMRDEGDVEVETEDW